MDPFGDPRSTDGYPKRVRRRTQTVVYRISVRTGQTRMGRTGGGGVSTYLLSMMIREVLSRLTDTVV